MAEIRPFRGLRYDLARVGGLEDVIGPPEDIPTVDEAVALVAGKPYHSIRLEMRDRSNLYDFGLSRHCLEQWLRTEVLFNDPTPGFYIHEHEYVYGGRRRRFRGFFAALRLTDYAEHHVLPHENTLRHNVRLRFALLRDIRANLSAVYTLARDWDAVEPVLDDAMTGRPVASGSDREAGLHRIWRLTDPAAVARLARAIGHQPLYIADGHHRYEAALAYRRKTEVQHGNGGASDWVLAYIAHADDPGILVLPMHRVIRSLGEHDCAETKQYLAQLFEIEEIELPIEGGEALVLGEVARLAQQSDGPSYLILEPDCRTLLAVRLREWGLALQLVPEDTGPITSRLDVAVLDAVLLRHFLGLGPEEVETEVDFTPDAAEAYRRVLYGEAAMSVFMRPTPLSSLIAVANSGGRMPQKSTYFYPKIPIGLVMRDLDADPDPVELASLTDQRSAGCD